MCLVSLFQLNKLFRIELECDCGSRYEGMWKEVAVTHVRIIPIILLLLLFLLAFTALRSRVRDRRL